MLHPCRDGVQKQWPTGDRLHMPIRLDLTNEDVPPVGQPATSKILRDEAAAAPLVLQLMKNILAIPYKMPLII